MDQSTFVNQNNIVTVSVKNVFYEKRKIITNYDSRFEIENPVYGYFKPDDISNLSEAHFIPKTINFFKQEELKKEGVEFVDGEPLFKREIVLIDVNSNKHVFDYNDDFLKSITENLIKTKA